METPCEFTSHQDILTRYMNLPIPDSVVQLTYVWIDGSGVQMRCKTKTVEHEPKTVQDCPVWIFDSVTCNFCDTGDENSDAYLQPVALFADPFHPGKDKLVLCETYSWDKQVTATNHRVSCASAMTLAAKDEPWFGFEQEYWILGRDGEILGWKEGVKKNDPMTAIGTGVVYGRELAEAHNRASLYAGVKISGNNSEYVTGQWEFQVGPCEGITVGDHVWMARFILYRLAEEFGLKVSLDYMPVEGDFVGVTGHTNFSTAAMREDGGIKYIKEAVEKLRHVADVDTKKTHAQNGRRRSCRQVFSAGVADRTASVRIPRDVWDSGRGFFEDRRPTANCDPYVVTEAIVRTCVLGLNNSNNKR